MIDKYFLTHVNKIFNAVGYSLESSDFNFDDFTKAAYNALKNCKSIEIAKKISLCIVFVTKNKNKIKNQIKDYYKYFSSLPHNPKTYTYRENEAVITMTNYLSDDGNNTLCLANFLDNEYLNIVNFESMYWMDDNESIYHIKLLSATSDSAVLLDKEDKPYWIMSIDKKGKAYFKNNRTNLSFMYVKDGISIYDSEYMKSVGNKPNPEEMVAFLELHYSQKIDCAFIARLNLFRTNIRLEILLLFVQSIFLLRFMREIGGRDANNVAKLLCGAFEGFSNMSSPSWVDIIGDFIGLFPTTDAYDDKF